MRIGCLCSNQYYNRDDHWVTARAEGRAMINMGFGLAEMGHEVGIFSEAFRNQENVWKKVSLYKFWDGGKHYDFIICFNPYNGSFGRESTEKENYSKILYLFYGDLDQTDALARYPKIVTFCDPAAYCHNYSFEGFKQLKPFEFFPLLFPIPCYDKLTKQDFQDFHFDTSKKTIKVWAALSSWKTDSQAYVMDDNVFNVLRILRDRLGYKIDLRLTVSNDDNRFDAKLANEFNAKIIRSLTLCYKDILDLISDTDLCIVKGGDSFPGNSSNDILALGVPMIYIVDGSRPPNPSAPNPITAMRRDLCVLNVDNYEIMEEKIRRQFDNLKEYHEGMVKCIDTKRFPIWSEIAKKILDKYK